MSFVLINCACPNTHKELVQDMREPIALFIKLRVKNNYYILLTNFTAKQKIYLI